MTKIQPVYTVTLPYAPQAKQRPRVYNGRGVTPKETKAWEARAAADMRAAITTDLGYQPLLMRLVAVWHRPSSRPRPKTAPDIIPRQVWASGKRVAKPTRPDLDNLKTVSDALQMAGVVRDDAQIVRMECVKYYAARGEEASVTVELYVTNWLEGDQ